VKRWAWNSFCLFSLLVFASSVILLVSSFLVRSEVAAIDVRSPAASTVYSVAIARGEVGIARDVFDDSVLGTGRFTRWLWSQQLWPSSLHDRTTPGDLAYTDVLGFQYNRWQTGGYSHLSRWHLVLPFWLFFPAAVPPFLWWRKWRKKGGRGFPVAVAGEKQMQ